MKIWIWALWYSTTVYFHWNNILSPIPWSNYPEQLYVLAKLAAAIMCHQRNDHICNHKRPPAQICHLFSIQGQPFKIHETIICSWKFSSYFKACTALVPREKHFAMYTLVNIGGESVHHFVLRMRNCLLNKKGKNWVSLTVCQVFCFRQSGMRSMLWRSCWKKGLGSKICLWSGKTAFKPFHIFYDQAWGTVQLKRFSFVRLPTC